MKTVNEIIEILRTRDDCSLEPPRGLPKVADGLKLPPDLQAFYELAGGATIADSDEGSPITICGPDFERLDITSAGEAFDSGPFENWFALADVDDGNYLAIDFHPDHSGKCYDTFHESFPFPGEVNVIASSFTELLNRIVAQPIESAHYWLNEDFEPEGEAFALYGYSELPPGAVPEWLGGSGEYSDAADDESASPYALGVMLGVVVGTAVGTGVGTATGNLGQGICIGAVIGVGLGVLVGFMRR